MIDYHPYATTSMQADNYFLMSRYRKLKVSIDYIARNYGSRLFKSCDELDHYVVEEVCDWKDVQ